MLSPMYVPLETWTSNSAVFCLEILSQNDYNLDNEHNTFKLCVIWISNVVEYNKHDIDILVIDYYVNLC